MSKQPTLDIIIVYIVAHHTGNQVKHYENGEDKRCLLRYQRLSVALDALSHYHSFLVITTKYVGRVVPPSTLYLKLNNKHEDK